MILRRASTVIALTIAALTLAGCVADATLELRDIDGPGSRDFSVTSARIERSGGSTHLILEVATPDPSAKLVLDTIVDLGDSYYLWCDGEPRRSPAGPGSSTWTLGCTGDLDWPSDARKASLSVCRVDQLSNSCAGEPNTTVATPSPQASATMSGR